MVLLRIILLCALLSGGARGAEDSVRFVFYNLSNWLVMERQVSKDEVSVTSKPEDEKQRVVEILKALKPDILGVAEVGSGEEFEDLRQRLADSGLDLPHTEFVKAADDARHIALLSRFPITERSSKRDVRFDIGGRWIPMQRGLLDVTLALPDGYTLRCLGAHLKSRREVDDYDQAELRLREAGVLRERADAILSKSPQTNLLVFGDFNDTKNEPPIREIAGPSGTPLALQDVLLSDHLGDRWTHYWRTADQYARIDYVFVSQGLEPEIDRGASGIGRPRNWLKASDHRPIFVNIRPTDRPPKR